MPPLFPSSKPAKKNISPAYEVETTLYGRWNDVTTLKRRHINVVLTSYAGLDNIYQVNPCKTSYEHYIGLKHVSFYETSVEFDIS